MLAGTPESMPKRSSRRVFSLSITVLIAGGLALVAGNAVSLWANLRDLEKAMDLVHHTWLVIDQVQEIRIAIQDAENGQRAYFATRNPAFLQPYSDTEKKLVPHFAALEVLNAESPVQLERTKTLRQLAEIRMMGMRQRISLFDGGDENAATRLAYGVGTRQSDELHDLAATMLAEERRLDKARIAFAYQANIRTNLLAGGLSALLLLLLVLTYVMINLSMRRRQKAERALKALNDGLESIVAQRTTQLSQLAGRLQRVAEEEKMALANELHDELGSNLTAMNLDIAAVAKRLQPTEPALAARLQRALNTLFETVELKRRVIHNLRPSLLDALGIGPALAAMCEDYTSRTGRVCKATIADDLGDMDPAWRITLYRIAQECLTNAANHANANEVNVVLDRTAQGIRLRVVDDGIGIAENALDKPSSHGLRGMRERLVQHGGLFSIQRAGDRGTIAEAFLPFSGLTVAL